MQQYQNVLQDKFGNVIVGASVAVYVYGTTTPATIYSGNGTGLLPSNTVTTNSLGEFAFYAANGRYSLSITATNFVAESYSDFILYDPADIGAVTASGVAFTPFGTVAATNVQNAIQEVVADLAGASGASTIGFAPSGTLSSTNVQAAITEQMTDLSASSGSSLVGFLQSGTGAVARTAQAKLRDAVSVKDFGAAATNTDAENKTALQAAIAAVSDAGGGLVVVPNDIDYGFKVYTPSTFPDLTSLTNGDVVVEDYACVDNETSGIAGAQIRYFYGTRVTTPAGQHNGNGELHYGDYHPYKEVLAVNPTPPATGGGGKYRSTYFAGGMDSSGNMASWGFGNGDVTAGAYGTTLEELCGARIFTAEKFIYNTSTSTWWRTAGATVFGVDRYSGCWAFNDTVSRSYAYKFRLPDGIHSSEIVFVGDTAAQSPTLRLVNSVDNQRFDIVAGTGTISYGIQCHSIRRILFDTNGWTHITDGSTPVSTAVHTIEKSGLAEGNEFLSVIAATFSQSARFFAVTNAGSNGNAAAMRVGTNSSTGRSINAGGTINASGADYAEYENNGGLKITKGSIVGFKSDGSLTIIFAEAIRFGIKSTNPSYVGGDSWGADLDGAALENARQMVDRIAYSGKVPVNVTGAVPGDYIVATAASDGSIVGVSVNNPNFAQYLKAVGRVNRILNDGRAEVAVIVH